MRATKPRKPRGTKLDGTPSLDMCPCCISFHCDPMSMSRRFQDKVRERRRMHLCPACGRPAGFCSCKSSISAERTGTAIRHDNRKLRQAMDRVRALERANQEWHGHADALSEVLGEDAYSAIAFALYHHDIPPVPWAAVEPAVRASGADANAIHAAWRDA